MGLANLMTSEKGLLSIPKVLKLSLDWFYLSTLLADGKIMICFAREKKAIIFAIASSVNVKKKKKKKSENFC
jgi:hypothetical protein